MKKTQRRLQETLRRVGGSGHVAAISTAPRRKTRPSAGRFNRKTLPSSAWGLEILRLLRRYLHRCRCRRRRRPSLGRAPIPPAHPQLLHGNRHPPITPQQPLPPQERALRPWMRKELKGSEGSSQGWMRSGWMVRMCQMRPLCARAPGRGFRAAAAPDPHRRGGAQVASGGGRLHAVRHRVRSLATQNYRRGTTSPSGVIPFRNLKRSLPVERTSIVFSAMMDL